MGAVKEEKKEISALMPQGQLSEEDKAKVAAAIGYNFESGQCYQERNLQSINPRYLMYPLTKDNETGLHLLVSGHLLKKHLQGVDQESEDEVLNLITQILETFPNALNIKDSFSGLTLCHLAAKYSFSKDGFIQHALFDLLNKTGKARWDICDISQKNCLMKLMNTREKFKFNPDQKLAEKDKALIKSMVTAKCYLESKNSFCRTVLYETVRQGGSQDVIRFLVELKANPHTLNKVTKPESTVDLAIYHRDREKDLIEYLQNAGKSN